MPNPAEIDVEECAAPKQSYSLSERLVKPDKPPPVRSVLNAVSAAGEDLVRIGLMADVPNQFVIGGVEDVVQSHCQLDHAETGPQMTASNGDCIDGLGAQFVGNLLQVPRIDTS